MNYNKDIDHIRILLDKYYRAETTPDEEQDLESFFTESNRECIPKDMEADARLFNMMRDLHPLPSECDVPDNLRKKLTAIVEQPQSSHRDHLRFFRILRYSGVAVAASIIWAIITLIPWSRNSEQHPESNRMYDASPVQESQIAEASAGGDSVLTIVNDPSDRYAFVDEPIVETTQTQPEAADGFIEITDPIEAGKIALEIGRLLAFNADKTNKAMAQIGNSIDCYKEITKSVLQ